MSVTPSHIANSVGQAALQQQHAARAVNAPQNAAARAAQRLRDQAAENMESVEDFYETTDDPLAVKRNIDHDHSGTARHHHQDDQPAEDGADTPSPQHIDLTA